MTAGERGGTGARSCRGWLARLQGRAERWRQSVGSEVGGPRGAAPRPVVQGQRSAAVR